MLIHRGLKSCAGILLVFTGSLALATHSTADRGGGAGLTLLKIGVDEAKNVETAEIIPISGKRGQKPVVVASLSPK